MQTAPIRDTKGSLESQIQGLHNDTTITRNGLGYFEMWPREVDLAPQNFDPILAISGSFFDREIIDTMTD